MKMGAKGAFLAVAHGDAPYPDRHTVLKYFLNQFTHIIREVSDRASGVG
jgi:hypothetical protein